MRRDTSKSISNGESALIRQVRSRVARLPKSRGISLGIGDDCALLSLKSDEEAAITTDLSLENRHFRLDLHSPESIGHRTLARGLSDLAAMGARPVAAFLSLGLPQDLIRPQNRTPSWPSPSEHSSWIDRFVDGLLALAARHKTPLAGGDLAECQIALADIVLVGAVPRGSALLRSGARPGDLLYVTGTLGGSAASLRKLEKLRRTARRLATIKPEFAPHLWPEPRVLQGLWLRSHHLATAAIDVSDGLSTDLDHLCEESCVAAEIHSEDLPISHGTTLEDALNGGEDYELLFTARSDVKIPHVIRGVPISQIGTIKRLGAKEHRVTLVDASGRRPLPRKGWEHFRTGERVSY